MNERPCAPIRRRPHLAFTRRYEQSRPGRGPPHVQVAAWTRLRATGSPGTESASTTGSLARCFQAIYPAVVTSLDRCPASYEAWRREKPARFVRLVLT